MAAVRHVVVGGVGASLSLDDIARVARGEEVVIDTAAAERIKKESPAPSKGASSVPTPSNEPSEVPTLTGEVPVTDAGMTVSLTGEQTRAAVLARLMSLVNGHSKVSPPHQRFMASLIPKSNQTHNAYAPSNTTLQVGRNSAACDNQLARDSSLRHHLTTEPTAHSFLCHNSPYYKAQAKRKNGK